MTGLEKGLSLISTTEHGRRRGVRFSDMITPRGVTTQKNVNRSQ
jgi:hypothetical protein